MGYGGTPYGQGPYGLEDITDPYLISAVSLDGFRIEIHYSEEMDSNNPSLLDSASYTITPLVGAPSTVISVSVGEMGSVGVLSVVLGHTGTTLGGTYSIVVSGPTDLAGNPVVFPNPLTFYTLGESPPLTVTPISSNEVLLDWDFDMLAPGDGSTIDQISSYSLTHPSYPIPSTLTGVTYPGNDNSQGVLEIANQTNHLYTLIIGPATSISYDGSIFPDASEEFTGIEMFAVNGTSSIVNGTYLSLSRSASTQYGWMFQETEGRLVPGSTFRADITVQAGTFTPSLSTLVSPSVATWVIEDDASGGGVQVNVSFERDGSDNDIIRLDSGAYNATFPLTWSDGGPHTVSVVRNTKADIYSLLFDGQVVVSTVISNFTAPSGAIGSAGAVLLLNSIATTIAGFRLYALNITATSTVFSAAWNFLHNYTVMFTGSILAAQKFLLTKKGPLVKGWGDATPATKEDVSVTVLGTPVPVKDVNPYIGRVELEIAVPTSNPPPEVLVDYKWMASPIMAASSLNTEGISLNKWDRVGGFASGPRFPLAVALGPKVSPPTPIYIGHRYLGFEREYSALLNSWTTARLNQSPRRTAVPGMERATEGISVAYDGLQAPTASEPPWGLSGTDTGNVNINEGTYTVVGAKGGSFNPDDPQAVVYSRSEDISFSVGSIPREIPSAFNVVGRFAVSDDSLLSPDGVFTGVGFGFHNNDRLFLVGALRVNGLSHVGLLTDATAPHLSESWSIGPNTVATINADDALTMVSSEIPPGLAVGDRFQVLGSDPQAGVYTVASLVHHTDGKTTVTIKETFPADYKLYGNTYPTVYFETPWEDDPSTLGSVENQTTYRLVADPDRGVSQLILSGGVSGLVAETLTPTDLPLPANTSLLLPLSEEGGLFFWGSLSRKATNRATWSFFRYGVIPDRTTERDQILTVANDMAVVPEDDIGNEWALIQDFGFSRIDFTGNTMLLKSTSRNENLDFEFGYTRTEPFLSDKTKLDFRASFQVDSGVLGSGDARVAIFDGRKEAVLGTLLYREDTGQDPYRQLLTMPSASFSGILTPEEQNFIPKIAAGSFSGEVYQNRFILSASSSQGVVGSYVFQGGENFDSQISAAPWTDSKDRIVEARFAVPTYTENGTGVVGSLVLASMGGRGVSLTLVDGGSPRVRLEDWAQVTVQDFLFDWTDGGLHNYRLLSDFTADTLVLVVDDVVQTPTLALSSFGSQGDELLNIGAYLTDVAQSITVEWDSASYIIQPPDDAKRTLGVFLGGDDSDIDNWEIPRTDSSTAANSSQTGPVIEEMDWRSKIDVRMYRDPTWGVTIYRPDIALPPYVQETFPPTAGAGFVTETTEPSAGWINVEYRSLPPEKSPFGIVAFGALSPKAITQQRWSSVSYRLYQNPAEDYTAPQGMVLNRFNTINSGEMTKDVTPEQVIVQPVSATQVSLLSTHLYADRIFKIIEEGNDPFTPEMFDFNVESQTATLFPDSEGTPRFFGVLLAGFVGSFGAHSFTFTDAKSDFSSVLPGHVLHITSGLSAGSYMVSEVLSLTSFTVATEFPNPSVGGVSWQITRQPQPVTVVFAPGGPVTNTYLCQQPLLDSVTLLNEGTPPFPKSQAAKTDPVIVYEGGVRLLKDDTLPDVQSDSWRVLAFQEVTGTYYEGMGFCEVNNGGDTGLLSSICEGQLGVGDSGWSSVGGDRIYSPSGGGDPLGGVGASGGLFDTGGTVGSPTGGLVLSFGAYLEQGLGLPKNALGGIPNPVGFTASGAGFLGPSINQDGGSIAILEPLNEPGQPGGSVEVILKDTTSLNLERWFFNG